MSEIKSEHIDRVIRRELVSRKFAPQPEQAAVSVHPWSERGVEPIKDWSLASLKEKLIKIGAKIVSHGRYVAFQMAEIAIPRNLFAEILRLIAELRPPLAASTA